MVDSANTIPFLRATVRSFLPHEAEIYRSRSGPLYAWLHQLSTFDEDFRPQLPSLSLDISAIPEYLRFNTVEECISQDVLFRTLYYASDPGRPLPHPVTPRDAQYLCDINGQLDARSGRSPVRYENPLRAGRMMSVGSIGSAAACFRNTVTKAMGYVELAIQDCYPKLLRCLGPLLGVQCPGLDRFLQDPAEVIHELAAFWGHEDTPLSEASIYALLRSTVNGGRLETWFDNLETAQFVVVNKDMPPPLVYTQIRDECQHIRDIIVRSNPHLADIYQGEEVDAPTLTKKVVALFCHTIEHYLLYTALEYCIAHGQLPLNNGKYCFIWLYDRLRWIPPRASASIETVVAGANALLQSRCGAAFASAAFTATDITGFIPEVLDDADPLWHSSEFRNYDAGAADEEEAEEDQADYAVQRTYEEFKEWFETKLDHFYVIGSRKYGRAYRNKKGRLLRVAWFTTGSLADVYKFVHYVRQKKVDKNSGQPVLEEKQGVPTWMVDKNHRWYFDARLYPPPMVCPKGHFNLWTESPYHDMPLRPGQSETPENLQAISDFFALLRVVVGDPIEEPATPSQEFKLLKWFITHMIQEPGDKPGIVPVLYGSEGCGKSLTGRIICKMVGEGRYLDTNMENVVGSFNSLLDGRVFVLINEYNKAMSSTQASAFKALITDNEVTINEKHCVQRETTSYHRFMITTNDHNVIASSRRPVYFRATLELKRREDDMLSRLWKICDNPKALAAIYRTFQNVDMEAEFGGKKMAPITNALNREFRRSVNPYIAFAHYLVHTVWHGQIMATLSGSELHQHWKTYCEAEHMTDTKTCLDVNYGFNLTPSWAQGCISEAFQDGRVTKRTYNVCLIRQELEKGI